MSSMNMVKMSMVPSFRVVLLLNLIVLVTSNWTCDFAKQPCDDEQSSQEYVRGGYSGWVTNKVEHPSTSIIRCAIRCVKIGCVSFFFQGGSKCIFAVGKEPINSGSDMFYRLQPVQNIALNKPTDSSSIYNDDHAGENAVDGIYEGSKFAPSSDDLQGWLLIDLEEKNEIRFILIRYHSAHKSGFKDIEVLFGNSPSTGDFSSYTKVGYIEETTIDDIWYIVTTPGPESYRFVVLHKVQPGNLKLEEIEVYT